MSSDHVTQAQPPGPPAPDAVELKHEPRDANIRIIVMVGVILIVSAVVIHVGVWLFFRYLEESDQAKTSNLPLVQAEMKMNQLPASPRLEAFNPNRAWVFLRTDGEVRPYYVDNDITVVRISEGGKETPLSLFDLRPDTEVTLTYHEPQTLERRPRVVYIETGPGAEAGRRHATETGMITVRGRIERIEPTGGPDKREAAEIRLRQYGWVNKEKQIAHIPIDKAMDLLLSDPKLLRSAPDGGKNGRPEKPEEKSGREAGGGRR